MSLLKIIVAALVGALAVTDASCTSMSVTEKTTECARGKYSTAQVGSAATAEKRCVKAADDCDNVKICKWSNGQCMLK